MKKIIIGIWLIMFVSLSSFGQEICDNGIDDDADGLIDKKDVIDCICNSYAIIENIPSIIPNPSFEEMIACPTGFGQLNRAKNWIQATSGTADYLHTCDFVSPSPTSNGLVPFPDGDAVAGIIIEKSEREYIGTCLVSPLKAGTEYTLKLHIASNTINAGFFAPYQIITDYGVYGPIDITIFGAEKCSSLPVNTLKCPISNNSTWKVLGSSSYSPSEKWSVLTIMFTPTEDVNTIMIGPPCTIPDNFPVYNTDNSKASSAYFYIDNLILNTSASFKPSSISQVEVFVPNAFSPNGDNNNDKLEIKINAECISDYSFMIFDRWGEKVFESTKITDSWDGKFNGKELDNAVFVYYAKLKLINSSDYIVRKGNVSLVR